MGTNRSYHRSSPVFSPPINSNATLRGSNAYSTRYGRPRCWTRSSRMCECREVVTLVVYGAPRRAPPLPTGRRMSPAIHARRCGDGATTARTHRCTRLPMSSKIYDLSVILSSDRAEPTCFSRVRESQPRSSRRGTREGLCHMAPSHSAKGCRGRFGKPLSARASGWQRRPPLKYEAHMGARAKRLRVSEPDPIEDSSGNV